MKSSWTSYVKKIQTQLTMRIQKTKIKQEKWQRELRFSWHKIAYHFKTWSNHEIKLPHLKKIQTQNYFENSEDEDETRKVTKRIKV